jgi:hypothetical protein
MHSLAPEILVLRGEGVVSAAALEQPLALEERRTFSLQAELRVALYAGVAAVLAGVGLLIRNNLDRIGPVALLSGILLGAAACYGFALRGRPRGAGSDYLLLLGALLASAGLGYAETQFHWLGENWSRHLLVLAVFHGVTAYLCDSRLVLAVAASSLAGWLGVETRLGNFWEPRQAVLGAGGRSLALAGIYLVARQAHLALRSTRDFTAVYEQFAVNFAFWGALALAFDPPTRWPGAALLLALALVVGRIGLRSRRESFVLCAVGYATFGLVALEARLVGDMLLASNLALLIIGAAVALLLRLRARLKEAAP